jgi:hypothetical protein
LCAVEIELQVVSFPGFQDDGIQMVFPIEHLAMKIGQADDVGIRDPEAPHAGPDQE